MTESDGVTGEKRLEVKPFAFNKASHFAFREQPGKVSSLIIRATARAARV